MSIIVTVIWKSSFLRQIIYRSERLVAFMFCKITYSLYVAKQLKAGSLYVH